MHVQNPLFPFIYSILDHMEKDRDLCAHSDPWETQAKPEQIAGLCSLSLSLAFVLPWHLTDVKCKKRQGECKRLSHSFKAWAPLDISSKYSSLQTLAKKASLLLHFKCRDFFFFQSTLEDLFSLCLWMFKDLMHSRLKTSLSDSGIWLTLWASEESLFNTTP